MKDSQNVLANVGLSCFRILALSLVCVYTCNHVLHLFIINTFFLQMRVLHYRLYFLRPQYHMINDIFFSLILDMSLFLQELDAPKMICKFTAQNHKNHPSFYSIFSILSSFVSSSVHYDRLQQMHLYFDLHVGILMQLLSTCESIQL